MHNDVVNYPIVKVSQNEREQRTGTVCENLFSQCVRSSNFFTLFSCEVENDNAVLKISCFTSQETKCAFHVQFRLKP